MSSGDKGQVPLSPGIKHRMRFSDPQIRSKCRVGS